MELISKKEFAERMGVSKSRISALLSQKRLKTKMVAGHESIVVCKHNLDQFNFKHPNRKK